MMMEEKDGGNSPELQPVDENGSAPRLYHWYIDKRTREDGTEWGQAHGNVTGHERLPDTMFIHTSRILQIEVKEEVGEAVIRTLNTEYHCRLSDCDFSRPGTSDFISGLSAYAEMYGKEKEYQQEDNTILLVLSDHERYYFEAMIVKENGKIHKGEMRPHIGSFQDSCLISCPGYGQIDIRYFPHYQHLETYCWKTEGLPVYLENAGDDVVYYTAPVGVIALNPGERKLVSEDAVTADAGLILNRGDLYPAMPHGLGGFEGAVRQEKWHSPPHKSQKEAKKPRRHPEV